MPFAASSSSRRHLHLIADDLTGALDTAAQFVGVCDTIRADWRNRAGSGSVALDTGARELSAAAAAAALVARLAQQPFDADALHFAKIDTLWRGHPAQEIAAWLRNGAFARCLIAPAFPHHGRVTRDGRQFRRGEAGWTQVETDLATDLQRLGIAVTPRRPGAAAPDGVSLWDAESDADLDAIVAAGRRNDRQTLWCGAGGLAAALARSLGVTPHATAQLRGPVLGLFGSDQPTTAAQVEACGQLALAVPDSSEAGIADIAARLEREGAALVHLALPAGLPRDAAASRIADDFARIIHALPRPQTLVVAGGETLRAICTALDTDHLELVGQIEPGVPCSIMRGGARDGLTVVSKSGAFGDRDLLKRLLARIPLPANGVLT
ncbi:four-carbon acid sugar kinase family protein [Bradyrhizobium sp. HKCCYLS20291]|uniref:four-carbon acid sugar kinase family protein n=1 Tax=Bradyrhizobium sp. HKCCYLS20291 TaxID=3420766 RepID=UPI003EC055FD